MRRPATVIRSLMIQVLVPNHVLQQLDAVNAPLGEVEREELDRAKGSLAPPQRDSIRHVRTQRPRISTQWTRAKEIADVWNRPIVAELNEEIVIQPFDVFVNETKRVLNQAKVFLQLILGERLVVPDAIDLGKSFEQTHAFDCHCLISATISATPDT